MSHRPDIKIFEKIRVEIDDAKNKIDLAIDKCREGRGMALEYEDLQLVKAFKAVETILIDVLEA